MMVTLSFWHSFSKWISDFSSTIKLLNQNSFIYCMIQCKSGHGPSKKPSNTHHHPNSPGLRHTLNLRAGARPGTNRFSYYNSDNSHWERERDRERERERGGGDISNDLEPCLSPMACRNPVLHLRLLEWNELRLIEKCISTRRETLCLIEQLSIDLFRIIDP